MRLREAAPLFSLVATMQVAAFHTFREFTEGASAIQSRNYKLIESLCRQPDASRLDSAAYRSVPEVRERVLAGQVTLDDAFQAARAAGHLSARDVDDLEQAMRRFAATLLRWRRTHYGIAVRMLGERTGTGYTEGSPYLKVVQAIPVSRLSRRDKTPRMPQREILRRRRDRTRADPGCHRCARTLSLRRRNSLSRHEWRGGGVTGVSGNASLGSARSKPVCDARCRCLDGRELWRDDAHEVVVGAGLAPLGSGWFGSPDHNACKEPGTAPAGTVPCWRCCTTSMRLWGTPRRRRCGDVGDLPGEAAGG